MRGYAGWVRCICAPKARSDTVVVIAVKLVQVVVETVIRLGIHPGDPAAAAAAAATAAVVGIVVVVVRYASEANLDEAGMGSWMLAAPLR